MDCYLYRYPFLCHNFCRVRRLRNFGKKGAGGGDSFCGLLFFLILLTLVRDKKGREEMEGGGWITITD